jgi:hypothetical protein
MLTYRPGLPPIRNQILSQFHPIKPEEIQTLKLVVDVSYFHLDICFSTVLRFTCSVACEVILVRRGLPHFCLVSDSHLQFPHDEPWHAADKLVNPWQSRVASCSVSGPIDP